MAISSYKTFLMKKNSSSYEKLIDIKDFPDIMGAPENLDTTTLSDNMRTYIPGIKSVDTMEFTANYTKEDFNTLAALEGSEIEMAVWFGGTESDGVVTPTGSDGKFTFKAYVNVYVVGTGVNEVVSMKVVVTPSTVIVFSES